MTRNRLARTALIGLVLAMLAAAYMSGVLARFSDLSTARQTLLGLGAWGQVAFIAAYAALQPFGVPGTIFVFVAPLIWPFWTSLAISMAGTMAASVIGFSFARFVARDWLTPKIPARFAKYNDALERHAFVTVALLRLIFWMPQALHAFLGLSKVPFWTHFWGSFVGYLPILSACSYFGPAVLDWLKGLPWQTWLLIVCVGVVLGLWQWHRRLVSRRRSAGGTEAVRGKTSPLPSE